MKHMTAGELRGASLVAIVDDVPAGLRLQANSIEADLGRWARGCSCGEVRSVDRVAVLSGISAEGRTTGAPLTLAIDNAAYAASLSEEAPGQASIPRPGSADLCGLLVADADDCRAVSEGSSARAEATLVAASSVAREFLADFGIEIHSYVTRVGDAAMREAAADFEGFSYSPLEIETSRMRCPSPQATRAMEEEVAAARAAGDTLGGQVAVVVTGVAAGMGGFREANMAARLSRAAYCAQGVTGVSFGDAREVSRRRGSAAHDVIALGEGGFGRASNLAGGIEGGFTTGMPIVMRAEVAPSPALQTPVDSIDLETLAKAESSSIDYSPCLVGGVAVAIEANIAFELASAYQEKFGGAAMSDIHAAFDAYTRRLRLAAR